MTRSSNSDAQIHRRYSCPTSVPFPSEANAAASADALIPVRTRIGRAIFRLVPLPRMRTCEHITVYQFTSLRGVESSTLREKQLKAPCIRWASRAWRPCMSAVTS